MAVRFRTKEGIEIEKTEKGGIWITSKRGVSRHLDKDELKMKHPKWDKD